MLHRQLAHALPSRRLSSKPQQISSSSSSSSQVPPLHWVTRNRTLSSKLPYALRTSAPRHCQQSCQSSSCVVACVRVCVYLCACVRVCVSVSRATAAIQLVLPPLACPPNCRHIVLPSALTMMVEILTLGDGAVTTHAARVGAPTSDTNKQTKQTNKTKQNKQTNKTNQNKQTNKTNQNKQTNKQTKQIKTNQNKSKQTNKHKLLALRTCSPAGAADCGIPARQRPRGLAPLDCCLQGMALGSAVHPTRTMHE